MSAPATITTAARTPQRIAAQAPSAKAVIAAADERLHAMTCALLLGAGREVHASPIMAARGTVWAAIHTVKMFAPAKRARISHRAAILAIIASQPMTPRRPSCGARPRIVQK